MPKPRTFSLIIISMLLQIAIAAFASAETPPDLFCDEPPAQGSSPAFVGKPISLVSGAESLVRTDLTIGNLYPIVITRRYNSRTSYDSPVGYGWALNYDKQVYIYSNGTILIRKECGQKKRFKWVSVTDGYVSTIPDNSSFSYDTTNTTLDTEGAIHYIVMNWETARDKSINLSLNADGTYTVTDKDGGVEQYDLQGRLAVKSLPTGNSLVFTYEDGSRSALWGLLPYNLNQGSSLIVAYGYHLSRIEEKNASGSLTGVYVSFNYDSNGRLIGISDSAGRTVAYGYDSIGNLVSVNGPGGTATYRYNDPTRRHLLTNIDEGQGEYINTYDATGRVSKQTHGNGEINVAYTTPYVISTATTKIKDASGTLLNKQDRTVKFDKLGLVSEETDAVGNRTVYGNEDHGYLAGEAHYDANNVLLSSTHYSYDSSYYLASYSFGSKELSGVYHDYFWYRINGPEKGNMLSKTDARGTITSYTYHPAFSKVLTETVKSVVDPGQNKVITNSYDDTTGHLLSITETGLLDINTVYTYTTTYDYDPNGKITSIDGPRTDVQDVTSFTYDPQNGNILTMVRPIIGTTTFSDHDSLGNPRSVTDPNGNVTTYTYDEVGRITSVKAPGDTNPAQYFYAAACLSCGDGQNKLDHIILPEGNRIDFGYDPQGKLNLIKDSANNTINYTNDSEGNKLTENVRDAGGSLQKTLSYQHDALNRLAKVVNPDSTFTQYTYDGLGNRASAKDPNGNTITYQYDALSRLITVIQPGRVTTSYSYNTNSNLTTVIDANNNTTTYKYDDHGRVYQVISPDTGTTTYQYDPAGNMISKTDAKGVTITYNYDALNRLTKIDFPSDTDTIYGYDNCPNGKGKLCSMIDASGTTSYEYTAKGQIKKETKMVDNIQYVTQYTYDQNGNVKTISYPSGRVITYNYNNDRVLSVLNNGASIASNITYKPFGGMSSITYGNGLIGSISYDNQYRVTGIQAGTVLNLSYNPYDANGNIMSIANSLDPIKNKTFTYDVLDRLSTATSSGIWGSLGWSYDGVGNRLTENASSYTYTPNTNKLTSANGISFGYDNDGNTTAEGSRQYIYSQNQRLIQVNNAGTTAYYNYNGNGQRVKKIVNGVATIFHFDQNGHILAESNSSGTITAEYVYLNGQPLAKIEGGNTYYYHSDHLGTPQKMTDGTGAIVWAADYKPFGEATITISTITNNLRFPGQYFDSETGICYNYLREYNPSMGKYLEADKIGQRGGLNIYLYTANNPITRFDKFGLDWYYSQFSGRVVYVDNNTGNAIDYGVVAYSGNGQGLNNPSMQSVRDVGPIVEGTYTIGRMAPYITQEGHLINNAMTLTPDDATAARITGFGRTGGFLWHNGNWRTFDSSHGCIAGDRNMRDIVNNSADVTLHVVRSLEQDFSSIVTRLISQATF